VTTERTRQRDVFLQSEADAWFDRNRSALARRDFEDDLIGRSVSEIYPAAVEDAGTRPAILEIGCGEGRRLAWLASRLDLSTAGIDPSSKAVGEALTRGVDARRGTADALPWDDSSFDIVVFGFCLYLCDLDDLFRIAAEANRVSKDRSWLVIQDFHAPSYTQRAYHHREGIQSNKMDFRRLFDWHPAYTCYSHRITSHGSESFTDDEQEWVATSIMRKRVLDI
jgi:ubiquinone/menaquinone biosynthesis C-methylase UbiE